MKTKTSNKLNIVLIAITLLLIFVAGISAIGNTNSWLIDKDEIGFTLNVQEIDITISQGERAIKNGEYIYLGTELLEANVKYLTKTKITTQDPETDEDVETTIDNSVVITNNETGVGYYIRFQVIAMADGVAYNINNCITTSDFYNRSMADGNWMYSVDGSNNNVAMTQGQTLTMIQDLKFSQAFINTVQGQFIKLHLIVEGSATGTFDGETAPQE